MWKKLVLAMGIVAALGMAACGGDDDGEGASKKGLGGNGSGNGGGGDCDTEAQLACIDSAVMGGTPGPCAEAWVHYLECLGESCGRAAESAFFDCVESECPGALPCYH